MSMWPRLPPCDYAVLLHATSARAKLWPEHQWVRLGDPSAPPSGLHPVLPWGSEPERQRSERLASLLGQAATCRREPPCARAAGLLGGARVVFGVDTGLTHLSVALEHPTIGIYCATDPAATGLYGSASAVNVGGQDGPPGRFGDLGVAPTSRPADGAVRP